MKVAVITMHSVYNYGTQLQALATQEKLKGYFGDIEFIDYKRSDTYGKGLRKLYSKGNPVRYMAFLPTYCKWNKVFKGFQKKYLNLSKKEYLSEDDFKDFEDKYDLYFTGSDQVWNSGWNKGILAPYYLSFVKDKPKYAYSASFGTDSIPDNEIKEIKEYLKEYKKITVREDTGLKILNEQLDIKNAERILDPTLVMPKEFWNKYKKQSKIKEKYILVYNLNNNPDFDNYAKKLEEKTGIKVYRFCTRYDQVRKFGKSLLIPDVLDFITLISNAEYVFTDSFHATAFSINMHVHPICIYPEKYSNRLSDFLKLVCCEEECKVKDYNDFSTVSKVIDYDKVDKILENERKKVDKFLSTIKEKL
ncbi:MAG: polysaccharide pyruvyl transferase family protein [Bacilli bacterium]|nr:polysaccharide pyruvyl transferase family protein [Bacilli bacterium]